MAKKKEPPKGLKENLEKGYKEVKEKGKKERAACKSKGKECSCGGK